MKIVAALTDVSCAGVAKEDGADMIEIRLDLMEGDPVANIQECRKEAAGLPIIATLRSGGEGGQFFGDADAWYKKLEPVIPFADYIDVEQHYAGFAPEIKAAGKKIIASRHEGRMMPLHELFMLERELRAYGDIPKIIVTPETIDDLIDLISFTGAAKKPICTGVMGPSFRYARAMLPFFGSELVYCHCGTATAEGQYTVREFAELMQRLGSGQP